MSAAGEARFALYALARHRIMTDGRGVTTLAAARGCPLRCRYCINERALRADAPARLFSPRELYELVRADDLYFQATGGGVTFGGGEPLLYAPFIAAFREVCGAAWRLTAETSLNVPETNVRAALGCLDELIVDVKDVNPEIYRAYTGKDNARALSNLRLALRALGPERVLVRVPRIPGFNGQADVERSVEALGRMGAARFDVFAYRTP